MSIFSESLLFEALSSSCPFIHENRLNAVMDVACALRDSQNLSLSAMGRSLSGNASLKSKIKKVDRLEGNKKLHKEISGLYSGLSNYVFTYLSQDKTMPILVDLCFMKDDRTMQMLSAEVASKGRSIPVYREVFKEGELKGRAESFLRKLKHCLPAERTVLIVMDAGFFDEWYKVIEQHGWYWVSRIRQGRNIKLSGSKDWIMMKDFIPTVGPRTKNYDDVLLTKRHQRSCRLITTRKSPKGRKQKISRGRVSSKIGSGSYRDSAKEPWLLATNLPSDYKAAQVVTLYQKRMQIEESFRDVKSHQFGLAGRYIRTTCTYRWSVKMLLAAIVQITYWIIGVIGHSQDMQRVFQANTVRDKKVFSYFTLGKLIIEHNKLNLLKPDDRTMAQIIQTELDRKW